MVALLLAALFQTAAPASPSPRPARRPPRPSRLCRTETVVGSTIKKRICRPKPVGEVAQGEKTDAAQWPRRRQ